MSVIIFRIKIPIYDRVCVSTPPYYLYLFEKSYPNVLLNRYDGLFCIQCMNEIQVTKLSVLQWNWILYTVFILLNYNKSTIDHAMYIKVFYRGTVSYLTVSNDDVLNTTNNET